ncbi:MAG: hypothetical protein JW913_00790 [Chitinispirillaceae bacterium]|nr:hypothetical protein [Chitinispirillaceae bacterium]
MRNRPLFSLFLILSLSASASAQKEVYIPRSITSTGMDLNKSSSQWCYSRSRETDNIVVFWEAGFGNDPSTASGSYRVDMDALLTVAEKSYSVYVDSLAFAIKGSSVIDDYKVMIFLPYSAEWAAYGSGQDDLVGSLQVNPAAANIDVVVAHELGHCFQYITGCDGDGGYRYGYGENRSGGNGFWEQCANWMAFKVFPEKQFTQNEFREYIKNNHLHILHETPRYANYFLPDYWTYKHGKSFMGSLWRDSRSPEDPVETYKRLNSLSQAQFNDEMYEHASRLTTWDIPDIKAYGAKYIDSRAQVKLSSTTDDYWLIDPSVCIENYGYNSIELNVPSKATDVTVRFRGKTGAGGFRSIKTDMGGWRYGFVALLDDNARNYSAMGTANVENGKNPEQTLSFGCPDNCSTLWLVVSGAPQEHWRHPWDDNTANDEQWPYEVQFTNTNLLGIKTKIRNSPVKDIATQRYPHRAAGTIHLPENTNWQIINFAGKTVISGYGNSIDTKAFSNGGYLLQYCGKHLKFVKSSMEHTAF